MSSLLPSNWLQLPVTEIAALAPLQQIEWEPFARNHLQLSIKREDLLGYRLGGNKVYKLYGHLQIALQQGGEKLKLASFGGAWSNHLAALGELASQLRLPLLVIVRGEEAAKPSLMLQELQASGAELHFVSRSEYRVLKELALTQQHKNLQQRFGNYYWIPEGGAGAAGEVCFAALRDAINDMSTKPVQVIAHACGTAASLAGLVRGAPASQQIVGVAVLKALASMQQTLRATAQQNWEIDGQSHAGGYAKLPGYLLEFMQRFEQATGIPLDPVYTAKMMYGLSRLAEAKRWPPGTHIVAIHSGGLQGRRGFTMLNGFN